MVSTAFAAALKRRQIYYGWVVVAVTFLTMLVTAAAMSAPGVMIVPLEHEFGWDNVQISSALAVRILLFGLFGPFAAAFMNRFGLRRVMVTALALIAASLLISLAMTQLWQLMLLWGILLGVGTGLTAMVLAATVATRWFTQRRGLVVDSYRPVRRPGNCCSCRWSLASPSISAGVSLSLLFAALSGWRLLLCCF